MDQASASNQLVGTSGLSNSNAQKIEEVYNYQNDENARQIAIKRTKSYSYVPPRIHAIDLLGLVPDEAYFNLYYFFHTINGIRCCPGCGHEVKSQDAFMRHLTSKTYADHREMLQVAQEKLEQNKPKLYPKHCVDFRRYPVVYFDKLLIKELDNERQRAMAPQPEDSVVYNIESESLPQKGTEEMQPPEDEIEDEIWLESQFFNSFPDEDKQKNIELEDIFIGNDVNSHFLNEANRCWQPNQIQAAFKAFAEGLLFAKSIMCINFNKFQEGVLALLTSIVEMLKHLDFTIPSFLEFLIFKLTNSKYLQEQYLKQNFPCGKNSIPVKFDCFDTKTKQIVQKEIGRYIHPETPIKMALSNKSLVSHILTRAERKVNLLQCNERFEDLNQQHPSKRIKKDGNSESRKNWDSLLACSKERLEMIDGTLQLEIGIDDFSVASRIFDNKKYLLVYLSFANIPIEYRLKRNDIYLLAIGDRSKMNANGATVNDFLRPLIQDLKPLFESGIPIKYVDGEGKRQLKSIKLSLSSVCADNLGRHELAGFSKHFGQGFICIMCGFNRQQFNEISNYKHCPLLGDKAEDIEIYNLHVNKAIQVKEKLTELRLQGETIDEKLRKRVREECGFKENRLGVVDACIFLELSPQLSVYNLFPPDPLHDLAEGIVLNTLDLLLRKSKLSINSQQVAKLINEFPLYNGNIRVTVKTATISLSRTNSSVIDQPGTRGRKPNSQSQGGQFPRPSNSILFSAVQPKTIKREIFTFHGKAVQKIELFSRFPQIFAKYLPPPTDSTVNDGLELFQTLSRICSLVYRYAITEEQRQELATLVRNLIELTCKLRNELVAHFEEQEPDDDGVHIVLSEDVEDEIVDAFDLASQQSASQANQQSQSLSKSKPKAVQMLYTVTAKLHNLLHYFDLTARFGPLNWQSTLRYERRHFTTKSLFPMLGNYRNVPSTLCDRQQTERAIQHVISRYSDINFYQQHSDELERKEPQKIEFLDDAQAKDKLGELRKLPSDEYPHQLNKQVLRQILLPNAQRTFYWIEPINYLQDKDGNVFARGIIYKRHRLSGTLIHKTPELRLSRFELVDYNPGHKSHRNLQVVPKQSLNYLNDFYFIVKVEEEEKKIFIQSLI